MKAVPVCFMNYEFCLLVVTFHSMCFIQRFMNTTVLAVGSVKKNLSKQKPKVLLAEDETGASSYLSELLSDLGFHETESSVQL